MTVISITLPYELLNKLDELVKDRGYYSRSEAIRDAIRGMIEESRLIRAEKVATTIMVTYIRGRDGVDRRLSELKHEFNDVVVESIHRHLGKKYCIDIMIAEGPIDRIRVLIGRIRGIHNIEQVKALFIPL